MMRLQAQQVHPSSDMDIAKLVSYMGALQAQDFPMCKWAIGVRMNDITEQQVNEAFDKGLIIRTHLLRPTWHLVAAEDLRWLLELTAPHINRMVKSWQKQLGISQATLKKSVRLLEKEMQGGIQLTREQIGTLFTRARIHLEDNRLAHLLIAAELNGTICSGGPSGNGQKYALLEEHIASAPTRSRPEALAELARRYFTSRGPATIQDFSWWSGLGLADCRQGLEFIKEDLLQETVEDTTFWFRDQPSMVKGRLPILHLLPAFDEFLISYRNRSASLADEHQPRLLTRNGIFWPMIVVNGKATGSWKRSVRKHKIVVEPEFFVSPPKAVMPALKKQVRRFAAFLGRDWEMPDK